MVVGNNSVVARELRICFGSTAARFEFLVLLRRKFVAVVCRLAAGALYMLVAGVVCRLVVAGMLGRVKR